MTTLAAAFDPADESAPGHYSPSQTALLLLDFHTMLIEKLAGPTGSAPLAVAAQMRHWAHSQGIQVIHALIDTHSTPFPTCKDGKMYAGVIEAMREGGGGGQEAAELLSGGTSDKDDVTFTRRPGHVSALKSPGLEDFLKQKGIKSLVLAGLSTSGCVTRTAFAACDAEFVVSVISDGCADQDKGLHELMVGKVLNNRGYVATAAEFQKGFAEAGQSGQSMTN